MSNLFPYCPYCDHEVDCNDDVVTEVYEIEPKNYPHTCEKCGKRFSITAYFEVTYETEPID